MKCLEDNKICPLNNLKCKECVLLDCKNTLALIEEVQEMERKKKDFKTERDLKLFYPECYKCPFLEVLKEDKIRCSYRVKNKCLIGGFNNESKSDRKI